MTGSGVPILCSFAELLLNLVPVHWILEGGPEPKTFALGGSPLVRERLPDLRARSRVHTGGSGRCSSATHGGCPPRPHGRSCGAGTGGAIPSAKPS